MPMRAVLCAECGALASQAGRPGSHSTGSSAHRYSSCVPSGSLAGVPTWPRISTLYCCMPCGQDSRWCGQQEGRSQTRNAHVAAAACPIANGCLQVPASHHCWQPFAGMPFNQAPPGRTCSPWNESMKATRSEGYWCSRISTPRASHRPLGLLLYRLAAYTCRDGGGLGAKGVRLREVRGRAAASEP